MCINDYDEYQDSFPKYREWKVELLIRPYDWDEYWGNNWSGYDSRHLKRICTYLNDRCGPYRSWKRYRKNQYKQKR